jgi:hypothetical protein
MEVLGLCWEYGDQWSINAAICFGCCDHNDALKSIDVISNTHGVWGLEQSRAKRSTVDSPTSMEAMKDIGCCRNILQSSSRSAVIL